MTKYSLLAAAVLTATLSAACSHKNKPSSSDVTGSPQDIQSALEKSAWTSCEQGEGSYNHDTSQRTDIEFKEGFMTQKKSFFGAADCKGVAANTSTEVNGYSVNNSEKTMSLTNIEAGVVGLGGIKSEGDKLSVALEGDFLVLTEIAASGKPVSVGKFTRAIPADQIKEARTKDDKVILAEDKSMLHDSAQSPVVVKDAAALQNAVDSSPKAVSAPQDDKKSLGYNFPH